MHLNTFLFVSFCTISVAEEFGKYKLLYGRIFLTTGSVNSNSFAAPSVTECGLRCSSAEDTCSMAYYNTSSSECRLGSWMDVDLVHIKPDVSFVLDTIVLVQNGYKMLTVRYTEIGGGTFPFSEAPAVCQRVGGRLATEAELEEAKDKGWNRCYYGWIADGRAMYWVAESTSGCSILKQERSDDLNKAHCIVV